jgi:hypothetical protein
MTSDNLILERQYAQGKPVVRAVVVIVNPENGRQTTIEKNFRIDTGFDGGAHVPDVHVAEANLIGVTPVPSTVILAGNEPRKACYCVAYLREIGNHELPAPGIEATLVLQGSSNLGLLGLEILKHFVAKFDGIREVLTITSPIQH